MTVQTGDRAPAEKTIWKYIQVSRELPEEVKSRILPEQNFGVKHGVQLLRLKDRPEDQLIMAEAFSHM